MGRLEVLQDLLKALPDVASLQRSAARDDIPTAAWTPAHPLGGWAAAAPQPGAGSNTSSSSSGTFAAAAAAASAAAARKDPPPDTATLASLHSMQIDTFQRLLERLEGGRAGQAPRHEPSPQHGVDYPSAAPAAPGRYTSDPRTAGATAAAQKTPAAALQLPSIQQIATLLNLGAGGGAALQAMPPPSAAVAATTTGATRGRYPLLNTRAAAASASPVVAPVPCAPPSAPASCGTDGTGVSCGGSTQGIPAPPAPSVATSAAPTDGSPQRVRGGGWVTGIDGTGSSGSTPAVMSQAETDAILRELSVAVAWPAPGPPVATGAAPAGSTCSAAGVFITSAPSGSSNSSVTTTTTSSSGGSSSGGSSSGSTLFKDVFNPLGMPSGGRKDVDVGSRRGAASNSGEVAGTVSASATTAHASHHTLPHVMCEQPFPQEQPPPPGRQPWGPGTKPLTDVGGGHGASASTFASATSSPPSTAAAGVPHVHPHHDDDRASLVSLHTGVAVPVPTAPRGTTSGYEGSGTDTSVGGSSETGTAAAAVPALIHRVAHGMDSMLERLQMRAAVLADGRGSGDGGGAGGGSGAGAGGGSGGGGGGGAAPTDPPRRVLVDGVPVNLTAPPTPPQGNDCIFVGEALKLAPDGSILTRVRDWASVDPTPPASEAEVEEAAGGVVGYHASGGSRIGYMTREAGGSAGGSASGGGVRGGQEHGGGPASGIMRMRLEGGGGAGGGRAEASEGTRRCGGASGGSEVEGGRPAPPSRPVSRTASAQSHATHASQGRQPAASVDEADGIQAEGGRSDDGHPHPDGVAAPPSAVASSHASARSAVRTPVDTTLVAAPGEAVHEVAPCMPETAPKQPTPQASRDHPATPQLLSTTTYSDDAVSVREQAAPRATPPEPEPVQQALPLRREPSSRISLGEDADAGSVGDGAAPLPPPPPPPASLPPPPPPPAEPRGPPSSQPEAPSGDGGADPPLDCMSLEDADAGYETAETTTESLTSRGGRSTGSYVRKRPPPLPQVVLAPPASTPPAPPAAADAPSMAPSVPPQRTLSKGSSSQLSKRTLSLADTSLPGSDVARLPSDTMLPMPVAVGDAVDHTPTTVTSTADDLPPPMHAPAVRAPNPNATEIPDSRASSVDTLDFLDTTVQREVFGVPRLGPPVNAAAGAGPPPDADAVEDAAPQPPRPPQRSAPLKKRSALRRKKHSPRKVVVRTVERAPPVVVRTPQGGAPQPAPPSTAVVTVSTSPHHHQHRPPRGDAQPNDTKREASGTASPPPPPHSMSSSDSRGMGYSDGCAVEVNVVLNMYDRTPTTSSAGATPTHVIHNHNHITAGGDGGGVLPSGTRDPRELPPPPPPPPPPRALHTPTEGRGGSCTSYSYSPPARDREYQRELTVPVVGSNRVDPHPFHPPPPLEPQIDDDAPVFSAAPYPTAHSRTPSPSHAPASSAATPRRGSMPRAPRGTPVCQTPVGQGPTTTPVTSLDDGYSPAVPPPTPPVVNPTARVMTPAPVLPPAPSDGVADRPGVVQMPPPRVYPAAGDAIGAPASPDAVDEFVDNQPVYAAAPHLSVRPVAQPRLPPPSAATTAPVPPRTPTSRCATPVQPSAASDARAPATGAYPHHPCAPPPNYGAAVDPDAPVLWVPAAGADGTQPPPPPPPPPGRMVAAPGTGGDGGQPPTRAPPPEAARRTPQSVAQQPREAPPAYTQPQAVAPVVYQEPFQPPRTPGPPARIEHYPLGGSASLAAPVAQPDVAVVTPGDAAAAVRRTSPPRPAVLDPQPQRTLQSPGRPQKLMQVELRRLGAPIAAPSSPTLSATARPRQQVPQGHVELRPRTPKAVEDGAVHDMLRAISAMGNASPLGAREMSPTRTTPLELVKTPSSRDQLFPQRYLSSERAPVEQGTATRTSSSINIQAVTSVEDLTLIVPHGGDASAVAAAALTACDENPSSYDSVESSIHLSQDWLGSQPDSGGLRGQPAAAVALAAAVDDAREDARVFAHDGGYPAAGARDDDIDIYDDATRAAYPPPPRRAPYTVEEEEGEVWSASSPMHSPPDVPVQVDSQGQSYSDIDLCYESSDTFVDCLDDVGQQQQPQQKSTSHPTEEAGFLSGVPNLSAGPETTFEALSARMMDACVARRMQTDKSLAMYTVQGSSDWSATGGEGGMAFQAVQASDHLRPARLDHASGGSLLAHRVASGLNDPPTPKDAALSEPGTGAGTFTHATATTNVDDDGCGDAHGYVDIMDAHAVGPSASAFVHEGTGQPTPEEALLSAVIDVPPHVPVAAVSPAPTVPVHGFPLGAPASPVPPPPAAVSPVLPVSPVGLSPVVPGPPLDGATYAAVAAAAYPPQLTPQQLPLNTRVLAAGAGALLPSGGVCATCALSPRRCACGTLSPVSQLGYGAAVPVSPGGCCVLHHHHHHHHHGCAATVCCGNAAVAACCGGGMSPPAHAGGRPPLSPKADARTSPLRVGRTVPAASTPSGRSGRDLSPRAFWEGRWRAPTAEGGGTSAAVAARASNAAEETVVTRTTTKTFDVATTATRMGAAASPRAGRAMWGHGGEGAAAVAAASSARAAALLPSPGAMEHLQTARGREGHEKKSPAAAPTATPGHSGRSRFWMIDGKEWESPRRDGGGDVTTRREAEQVSAVTATAPAPVNRSHNADSARRNAAKEPDGTGEAATVNYGEGERLMMGVSPQRDVRASAGTVPPPQLGRGDAVHDAGGSVAARSAARPMFATSTALPVRPGSVGGAQLQPRAGMVSSESVASTVQPPPMTVQERSQQPPSMPAPAPAAATSVGPREHESGSGSLNTTLEHANVCGPPPNSLSAQAFTTTNNFRVVEGRGGVGTAEGAVTQQAQTQMHPRGVPPSHPLGGASGEVEVAAVCVPRGPTPTAPAPTPVPPWMPPPPPATRQTTALSHTERPGVASAGEITCPATATTGMTTVLSTEVNRLDDDALLHLDSSGPAVGAGRGGEAPPSRVGATGAATAAVEAAAPRTARTATNSRGGGSDAITATTERFRGFLQTPGCEAAEDGGGGGGMSAANGHAPAAAAALAPTASFITCESSGALAVPVLGRILTPPEPGAPTSTVPPPQGGRERGLVPTASASVGGGSREAQPPQGGGSSRALGPATAHHPTMGSLATVASWASTMGGAGGVSGVSSASASASARLQTPFSSAAAAAAALTPPAEGSPSLDSALGLALHTVDSFQTCGSFSGGEGDGAGSAAAARSAPTTAGMSTPTSRHQRQRVSVPQQQQQQQQQHPYLSLQQLPLPGSLSTLSLATCESHQPGVGGHHHQHLYGRGSTSGGRHQHLPSNTGAVTATSWAPAAHVSQASSGSARQSEAAGQQQQQQQLASARTSVFACTGSTASHFNATLPGSMPPVATHAAPLPGNHTGAPPASATATAPGGMRTPAHPERSSAVFAADGPAVAPHAPLSAMPQLPAVASLQSAAPPAAGGGRVRTPTAAGPVPVGVDPRLNRTM